MATADDIARHKRLVGRVLGEKFRITACIGIGGTGAVYRADQIALGRTVAVKVLSEELTSDVKVVRRFRDEAMAASRLNHPNTVSIIDYGRSPDGLLYLVMEYLKGPTLTQLIQKEHPLPLSRVLDIVSQILSGIEDAHLAGVVHADMKSDNIIVDQRRAGADVVKIVDFGIARLVTSPREGEDRSVCGTPEYMAPEVISGAAPGFAADLYAVGIILFELLSGKTPFVATSTVEILAGQLKHEPPTVSGARPNLALSHQFDELLKKALAKAPTDRYGSAAEMRSTISAIGWRLAKLDQDATECASCGARVEPAFRFCPACGQSRGTLRTAELPPLDGRVSTIERLDSLPLLGRQEEALTLAHHIRGAGETRILIVSGDSGSGRTRFVQEGCRRTAESAGVVVYQTGADPTGLASTYYPIRALIASLLSLPPLCRELDVRNALAQYTLTDADIYGVMQLYGHPSPLLELEPIVRRRETITSVLSVIRSISASSRIALVFDDVDHYDAPSLELLRQLCAQPDRRHRR